MSGTAGRGLLGLVSAIFVSVICLTPQPVLAAAHLHGVLYGITFPSTVATIDPASGNLTQVAPLGNIGPNAFVAALAADQRGLDLVALVGTCTVCPSPKGGGPVFFRLATIDPRTGSVRASPVLQRPLADSIAVDPATQQVWGVTYCFTCASDTVVLVDPSSGVETDVATLPVRSSFDTMVALAPKSHSLYLAIGGPGNKKLISLNTRTQNLTTGPSIGPEITGMAVDTSTGALFVLRGGISPATPVDVERIDPVTGSQTVLATFGAFGLSFATIDSRSHTLLVAGQVAVGPFRETEIVTVDDRTGAMTAGQPINASIGPLAFQRTPRHSDEGDTEEEDPASS